ncbi:MAG: HAD family hydrolase [Chloroflexi bacterium]|nr:HAD family hydrolase [Chloroflexota bacterium]
MIKAIAFDWGNTLMQEVPLARRPSARSPTMEVAPGVTEALKTLHRKYLCCVASNARGPESTALGLVLERVGLDKYFGHVFTTEELGAAKPDLKFFKGMLLKLQLQPQECIMVGDDYQADMAGAKAAGMKTIWVAQRAVRESPDADVVITSMNDLLPAIAKLAVQGERTLARAV